MTSNHHAPYGLGYKRNTMAYTKGCERATWSKTHKVRLSSDWSLQLDSMKAESLVIADQHAAVNTFPGLVHTARPYRDWETRRRLDKSDVKAPGSTWELHLKLFD